MQPVADLLVAEAGAGAEGAVMKETMQTGRLLQRQQWNRLLEPWKQKRLLFLLPHGQLPKED